MLSPVRRFAMRPTSIAPISICAASPKPSVSIGVTSRQFSVKTGRAASAIGRTVCSRPGMNRPGRFTPPSKNA